MDATTFRAPFADFAPPVHKQTALRRAITAAYRRSEPECVPPLIEAATLPRATRAAIKETATDLVRAVRAKPKGPGVESLVREYDLSSDEGVALMCLAEALLRIPDIATRDALIRDKIAKGNWSAHIGGGRSLFVNAATWGLAVTGRLTASADDHGLSAALTRLIARCGEPIIRRGVDLAMRMLGEQFVTGETIEEALERSRPWEAKGFTYSYDMLGEAAMTAADAARYHDDYERAIHAIGKASARRGVYAGPGISIKLSALHPRYARAQAERVMQELLPRLKNLAGLARSYDIAINIDAEEADRLELSLDLLEEVARDPELDGWQGLGFVVQAYSKRCPFVLDYVIDLAKRSGRRIMVRLVKGAYWDAEIKRAQIAGLSDFPVYTRKIHTDLAYIACARKLLAATQHVYPQFATHNAQTLSSIYHLAGPEFQIGDYEFQCLHGMGEPLYEEVVGAAGLGRPCRIYAPVGTHETLLAYLVRRLLENGANSSFVRRIGDPKVRISHLTVDPVDAARTLTPLGEPHPQIRSPVSIFGRRRNSVGLDLSDESVVSSLAEELQQCETAAWRAAPMLGDGEIAGAGRPVRNPADLDDVVGTVIAADEALVARATALAAAAARSWAETTAADRAGLLERAADLLQERMPQLVGLIVREAGKSVANAVDEVREAIDYLRYYGDQARQTLATAQRPLGPVACISPWNFPLAIFVGQVAAALAAGNPVLAKPAEETPLAAAEAVRALRRAGIPNDVLQLLPGDGRIGAALAAAPSINAVMFTGSTEVARLIQLQLSRRLSGEGRPIPLIAETGGCNAMIVDSSALPEQVVQDVIASAFDSAGQRCSALRVLALQNDVADRVLDMLKGALRELSIGRTDRLATDVGPVITPEAKAGIERHIEEMRRKGRPVEQLPLPQSTLRGCFVAPTIIELQTMSELQQEVFGPVLHIIRYRREDLDRLVDDINATGYGLTFGLHTRLDETISRVTRRVKAGNLYINRNVIGAVVGLQPFGGRGLSGTGPKAGGPLYLERLLSKPPWPQPRAKDHLLTVSEYARWLAGNGATRDAERTLYLSKTSAFGLKVELPGPVGERNLYALRERGRLLLLPATQEGLFYQLAACLVTGNQAIVQRDSGLALEGFSQLPRSVASRVKWTDDWKAEAPFDGVLVEGDHRKVAAATAAIAELDGPIVLLQAATPQEIAKLMHAYSLNLLMAEVVTSINTAAAGGNASLMTIA